MGKNYTWVKGYKYQDVPVFAHSINFLGFKFSIVSHKTRRRRVGMKLIRSELWAMYEKLLTPKGTSYNPFLRKLRKRKFS